MELSELERAVLAHVVVDPDAWLAHAVATFGEAEATRMLASKVARWQPDYESASGKQGYLTRAERDAIAARPSAL